MFRLNHILTPSNWPHAGRVCCCALQHKCRSQGGCCLWAQVPVWWLWRLSPALTLALRGWLLPRNYRPQSHRDGAHILPGHIIGTLTLPLPVTIASQVQLSEVPCWDGGGLDLVQVLCRKAHPTVSSPWQSYSKNPPYFMCLLLDH